MNDIIVGDLVYEFIEEFDTDWLNDFDNRKAFAETLGEDILGEVTFYESYKNVLRYGNDKYLIVCKDYRLGFNLNHSVSYLLLCSDEISVYKIKKDSK